jgi:hypothetical protein
MDAGDVIVYWYIEKEIEYILCVQGASMENVLSCKIIEHEQSFCVYLFSDFSQAEQKQPLHRKLLCLCTCKK